MFHILKLPYTTAEQVIDIDPAAMNERTYIASFLSTISLISSLQNTRRHFIICRSTLECATQGSMERTLNQGKDAQYFVKQILWYVYTQEPFQVVTFPWKHFTKHELKDVEPTTFSLYWKILLLPQDKLKSVNFMQFNLNSEDHPQASS